MKIAGILFTLCFLILGVMFYHGQKPAAQTLVEVQETPGPGVNIRSCQTDQDCIGVDDGCCGCKAGGKKTAINRKYYSHYLGQIEDSCFLARCPAGESTHQTCGRVQSECINNICQLN